MLYKLENKKLIPKEFYTLADFGKIEKDLEEIISSNMFETIYQNERLLPVHQERCFQPEQDITALDSDGNIIIFELKRFMADDYTIAQIFRYAQKVQKWTYQTIQSKLKNYIGIDNDEFSLQDYHKEMFYLDDPLNMNDFNKEQKMIIIGNSLDENLKNSINYWQQKGLEIDFIPYRLYDFDGDVYIEIFTKPFDSHHNPKSTKGVIFDSNRTYDDKAAQYMLKNNRISSFWDRKEAVCSLKKNDYVFLSHRWVGIIAAAKVISDVKKGDYEGKESELYVDVKFLNKNPEIESIISYSRITELTGKTFFHARIDKRPYLTYDEVKLILNDIGVYEH